MFAICTLGISARGRMGTGIGVSREEEVWRHLCQGGDFERVSSVEMEDMIGLAEFGVARSLWAQAKKMTK